MLDNEKLFGHLTTFVAVVVEIAEFVCVCVNTRFSRSFTGMQSSFEFSRLLLSRLLILLFELHKIEDMAAAVTVSSLLFFWYIQMFGVLMLVFICEIFCS